MIYAYTVVLPTGNNSAALPFVADLTLPDPGGEGQPPDIPATLPVQPHYRCSRALDGVGPPYRAGFPRGESPPDYCLCNGRETSRASFAPPSPRETCPFPGMPSPCPSPFPKPSRCG